MLEDERERKNTAQDLIDGYYNRKGYMPAMAEDINVIATLKARE